MVEKDRNDQRVASFIEMLRRPLAMRVSYTKLDTYRTCPKKYYFNYIERAAEAPNEKLLVGQAVHSTLETWVAEGGQDLGDLMDLFAVAILKQRTEGPISEEEEELARQMLIGYYDRLQEVDRSLIVGIEHQFELFLDGVIIVTGVMDRVEFETADGETLFVKDYKTGRYSLSPKQASESWQMALYHLAAKQEWPKAKRVICEFIYTRLGKSVKHEFTDEQLQKIREDIKDLSINMRLDTKFKPTGKLFMCGNCPYVSQCGWGKKQAQIWANVQAKKEREKAAKCARDGEGTYR